MKQYNFWKAFLKYTGYLLALLVLLFVGLLLVFGFNVNREINETAENQTKSVQYALEHHHDVDQGHNYFIFEQQRITSNQTPFTKEKLKDQFVGQVKKPRIDETDKGVFDVRKVELSDHRTLYSLTNVTDFHETKHFLMQELTIGFAVAFILMIAMAYYLARQPVKVYEQLMQEQQVFVQNASHEMKTPIASLLLGTQYLEMLEKTHLSAEGQKTLRQMKTEAQYMQQLIETMLQDTTETSSVETINVSQLFDETIQTSENVHHSKIQRRYQRNLMYAIQPLHVKQILNILLENAYHHNPEGVAVNVSAFPTVNGIQIEVSDNGKGIAEAEQDKIFQRFYRVNQEQRGSGIGLALLRNIVAQYGGTIEVKSQLGKGTNFIIKL